MAKFEEQAQDGLLKALLSELSEDGKGSIFQRLKQAQQMLEEAREEAERALNNNPLTRLAIEDVVRHLTKKSRNAYARVDAAGNVYLGCTYRSGGKTGRTIQKLKEELTGLGGDADLFHTRLALLEAIEATKKQATKVPEKSNYSGTLITDPIVKPPPVELKRVSEIPIDSSGEQEAPTELPETSNAPPTFGSFDLNWMNKLSGDENPPEEVVEEIPLPKPVPVTESEKRKPREPRKKKRRIPQGVGTPHSSSTKEGFSLSKVPVVEQAVPSSTFSVVENKSLVENQPVKLPSNTFGFPDHNDAVVSYDSDEGW